MKRNFILALNFSTYSCSELKGCDQINENNENSMVTKGWGNWKVINIYISSYTHVHFGSYSLASV